MKRNLSPVHHDYGIEEPLSLSGKILFVSILIFAAFIFFTGVWFWVNKLIPTIALWITGGLAVFLITAFIGINIVQKLDK